MPEDWLRCFIIILNLEYTTIDWFDNILAYNGGQSYRKDNPGLFSIRYHDWIQQIPLLTYIVINLFHGQVLHCFPFARVVSRGKLEINVSHTPSKHKRDLFCAEFSITLPSTNNWHVLFLCAIRAPFFPFSNKFGNSFQLSVDRLCHSD